MDSYPQSQYRADAKLGLADSYLGEHSSESSVLAINEYREFLSFYPTHSGRTTRSTSWGCATSIRCTGPIAIRPKRSRRLPS